MTDKMRHEALVQSTVPVAQMLLAHTEFTWDVNFCSENSKHFGDNPLHYAVGIADLERIDFWISKIDRTRPNALGENLLERASRPYSVMIPSRDPNSSPGSWARTYALFMEELRNRVL